jgi:hypothetical protein
MGRRPRTSRGSAGARVAATGQWVGPEGTRLPMGEVHAWVPGGHATTCGLPLGRAGLAVFPHVGWTDVDPARGGLADRVSACCPRCVAAVSSRRRGRLPWPRSAARS